MSNAESYFCRRNAAWKNRLYRMHRKKPFGNISLNSLRCGFALRRNTTMRFLSMHSRWAKAMRHFSAAQLPRPLSATNTTTSNYTTRNAFLTWFSPAARIPLWREDFNENSRSQVSTIHKRQEAGHPALAFICIRFMTMAFHSLVNSHSSILPRVISRFLLSRKTLATRCCAQTSVASATQLAGKLLANAEQGFCSFIQRNQRIITAHSQVCAGSTFLAMQGPRTRPATG